MGFCGGGCVVVVCVCVMWRLCRCVVGFSFCRSLCRFYVVCLGGCKHQHEIYDTTSNNNTKPPTDINDTKIKFL